MFCKIDENSYAHLIEVSKHGENVQKLLEDLSTMIVEDDMDNNWRRNIVVEIFFLVVHDCIKTNQKFIVLSLLLQIIEEEVSVRLSGTEEYKGDPEQRFNSSYEKLMNYVSKN